MAQRSIIVLGVLLAAGYFLWQGREAPAPVVPEAESETVAGAPSLVGMKFDGGKQDLAEEATPGDEIAGQAGAPTSLIVRVTLQGKPAPAGVLVRMRPEKRASGRTLTANTNAAGEAAFGEVLPGLILFEAHWSGYALTSTYWEYEAEDPEDRPTIDLAPGIHFAGRVLDVVTGAPIEGASVVLDEWSDGFEVGPTDEEGRFRVPGVRDEEEYELVARAPGYVARSVDILADSGRVNPAEPILRLVRGGALLGTVVAADGTPVPNARVRVAPHFPPEAETPTLEERVLDYMRGDDAVERYESEDILYCLTRSDGSFRAEGLAFGTTYDVTARARGHAQGALPSGIEVSEATPERTVEVSLRRPGRVLLRVVPPEDGHLPAEFRVRIFEAWRAHEPDGREPDGRFRFDAIDPGLVHGYAQTRAYRPSVVPIRVDEGATVEAELHLARGCAVEGLVVDPEGKPVRGATVRAAPVEQNKRRSGDSLWLSASRSTKTDSHGHFEIAGLPAGETYVVARFGVMEIVGTGYRTRKLTTPGRVRCTAPTEGLRLKLVQRGSIRVRLLMPDGEAYRGVTGYWIEWNEGGSGSRREPADGVLEWHGLADGDYFLTLVPKGYAWLRKRVKIRDGSTADLGDVVLTEGVVISGQVVDDTGAPVEGARIRCHACDDRQTITGAEGRFSLEHFPNKDLSFSVNAERHSWEFIDVRAGETTGLRFVIFRGAHVKAKAQSPDGTPRTDLSIEFRPVGAKQVTHEEEQPDGSMDKRTWFENAEWGYVDESGSMDEFIRPGKYVAYWEDEAGAKHELGAFAFEATETYQITLVLPAP